MHNRIEQVQRICIRGLGPQTPSVVATEQHRTQQPVPTADVQQKLLPWGTLDGALQILEGFRDNAVTMALDGKGHLGQVRPYKANYNSNPHHPHRFPFGFDSECRTL